MLAEYTTKDGVKTEEWAVRFVNSTNGSFAPIVAPAAFENSGLSDEQKEAVAFVCRSRNQVVAVRGIAGTGKTTMLKALDQQLRQAGREMLYLAPTASAVRTLQREGFENATTVSDYLANKRPSVPSVIIVDEAGLQSGKQGSEVLSPGAKASAARCLCRGFPATRLGRGWRLSPCPRKSLQDRKPRAPGHPPPDRGRLPPSSCWQWPAGKLSAGMEQLDAMGWVQERNSEYLQYAANAWMERTEQGSKAAEALLVAPTWSENFALSQFIRGRLKENGKLGESIEVDAVHSEKWTTEKKTHLAELAGATPGLMVTATAKLRKLEPARAYEVESVEGGKVKLAGGHVIYPEHDAKKFDVGTSRRLEVAKGDQLLIRMNDGPRKTRNLVNGQVVTVAAIRSDGSMLTEGGMEIPATFRQFAHGYVVTSHKAQGRTARHVIVAAERLDSKSAYVGCSRGRESCTVFTPIKEGLFGVLPFDGNSRAALDVLKEQRQVARTRISRPLSVVNRIKTATTTAAKRSWHSLTQACRPSTSFCRVAKDNQSKEDVKFMYKITITEIDSANQTQQLVRYEQTVDELDFQRASLPR